MNVDVLVFEEGVLRMICGYAMQIRSLEETQAIYDQL